MYLSAYIVDMDESSINGSRKWSISEAINYINEVAGDDVAEVKALHNDIKIVWTGNNRIGVFQTLLEHGWVFTSTCNNVIWLEEIVSE